MNQTINLTARLPANSSARKCENGTKWGTFDLPSQFFGSWWKSEVSVRVNITPNTQQLRWLILVEQILIVDQISPTLTHKLPSQLTFTAGEDGSLWLRGEDKNGVDFTKQYEEFGTSWHVWLKLYGPFLGKVALAVGLVGLGYAAFQQLAADTTPQIDGLGVGPAWRARES